MTLAQSPKRVLAKLRYGRCYHLVTGLCLPSLSFLIVIIPLPIATETFQHGSEQILPTELTIALYHAKYVKYFDAQQQHHYQPLKLFLICSPEDPVHVS